MSHRDNQTSQPQLMSRGKDPDNLETPLAAMDRLFTPNEQFFVRNHFANPEIEVHRWKLRVEGAVERPVELSYDEILGMASVEIPATLECAGNGRSYLDPPVNGLQWGPGAVSTAAWTGPSLGSVLARAGVAPGAVEVVLEGADRGVVNKEMAPPGEIPYARSLPLQEALRPEVVVAHRMNGQVLPREHGYPIRVVVPGWYAMASVKWLSRIVVLEHPFSGYYQTLDYSYWERVSGLARLIPLGEMQLKAQIARPAAGEVLCAGTTCRIHGAAWGGGSGPAAVDVSTDGGKTWHPARLLGEPLPHSWRLWDYDWKTPEAGGQANLIARAMDFEGNSQPATRDLDRGSYMITHLQSVIVDVRQQP